MYYGFPSSIEHISLKWNWAFFSSCINRKGWKRGTENKPNWPGPEQELYQDQA